MEAFKLQSLVSSKHRHLQHLPQNNRPPPPESLISVHKMQIVTKAVRPKMTHPTSCTVHSASEYLSLVGTLTDQQAANPTFLSLLNVLVMAPLKQR